ncbi:RNI-like protein [Lentinula aff. detonsa]|uniref:RNI-like protein n=1 Tax=Lentinula aff. detonsa TaxID=2804958 RepID=A0AA38L701_9AGAR|nr:RNI-like protein [Lentinula aff. detonsa]
MKYQRLPSTTSLSDEDYEEVYLKPDPSNITVAPAQWSRPNPPSTRRNSRVSPISCLPPEILIHILKHIHSSRDLVSSLQVCHTWCECSVELLWHKPNLNKYFTVEKMARLLAVPDQTFTYASFIRRLNLIAVAKDLRDDIFCNFGKCDRLERLTLVNCYQLSEAAILQTLPCFPNLVAVDLTGVVNTSDEAIIGLASVAKRLQGINLTGCKHVFDKGVMALALNCPLLRRVKLSGLEDLTDKPLRALFKSCSLLLEIELSNCKLVTDIAIRDSWVHSTHMREMRLSQCTELTDTAFPAPIRRDLKGVSEPTVNPFASFASESADLFPLIINRTFEHLRMLDLTACSQVTDDAIEGIISHAPKIRNLVLSKCGLLTDRSVENICKLGRHLHYLHLGHASKITDGSVRTLARSCNRLRYVDFANCHLLTDLAVFELAALPKLRRIGLVRVPQLTDEAVYALADRHATLERIHLSYCDQISVMAIHFLLQKLHKLTHLSLTGVTAFRQPELQRFCRAAPADYNSAQQNTFCVFSGAGVVQLRAYLTETFDRITEQNGTDDTEYEDDGDNEEEETPEPELDPDLEEHISRTLPSNNSHITIQRGHRPNWRPRNSSEEHVLPTIPTDRPIPNSLLARLNAVMATEPLTVRASSSSYYSRSVVGASRNITETLPIIEDSHSPPPSDVASNASGHSNGAGFFRSYQEGIIHSRANEVRTPDLNFAEIGHGRGAVGVGVPPGSIVNTTSTNFQIRRAQVLAPHARPPPIDLEHADASSSSQSPPVFSSDSHPQSSIAWPYHEPASPPLTGCDAEQEEKEQECDERDCASKELHESVRAALAGPSSPVPPCGSRGRGVKKSLRNTINAAEQNISSFLFGRSPAQTRSSTSDEGHATSSNTRYTTTKGGH